MRWRFVHASDLHLDTPFFGLGRVAPAVADALRDASLRAWDALVELCLAERAALLVLAGDVYDGAERGLRAQLRVLHGLRRLDAAGVRTFVVHGNHDPLSGWSAVREWPRGVHVFGAEGVESVAVPEVDAVVHGVSFGSREERRNLARLFHRAGESGLHVGVLHANVGGDPEHEAYAPCSVEDLSATGIDYWALGHVHRRMSLGPAGGRPWVEYPGCLQGRHPAAGELGPKGALVVEVEGGAVAGPPRFVALDRVRFLDETVDVSGAPDLPGVLGAVQDAAEALRAAHGQRGLLVRLRLTGRTSADPDLRRAGEVPLLAALREAGEGGSAPADSAAPSTEGAFLWWESLRLLTAGAWDRAEVAARGDFAAELVRQVDVLRAEAPRLVAEAAGAVAGVARRCGLEGDAEDPEALLAQAERRCLDLLLPGGGAA